MLMWPTRVGPKAHALMTRAGVLVLSSMWGGLSSVVVESLAAGCPAVSSDYPQRPGGDFGQGRTDGLCRSASRSAARQERSLTPGL